MQPARRWQMPALPPKQVTAVATVVTEGEPEIAVRMWGKFWYFRGFIMTWGILLANHGPFVDATGTSAAQTAQQDLAEAEAARRVRPEAQCQSG